VFRLVPCPHNCRPKLEPTVPPPTSDRAAMLPAEPIPSTTVPAELIAVVPAEPARALPEAASAVVAPETVARPPRVTRRTGYSGSRHHAESSRAHSQAPARRSGGYAVLWSPRARFVRVESRILLPLVPAKAGTQSLPGFPLARE
jgi:hypothetical protein